MRPAAAGRFISAHFFCLEQDPERSFAAVAGRGMAEGQYVLAAAQPAFDQMPQDAFAVQNSLRQSATAMDTIKRAYEKLNWANTGMIGAISGALPGGGP